MAVPGVEVQKRASAAAAVLATICAHRVDASDCPRIVWRKGQRPCGSTGPAENSESSFHGAAIAELGESKGGQLLATASDSQDSKESVGRREIECAIAQAVAEICDERGCVKGKPYWNAGAT